MIAAQTNFIVSFRYVMKNGLGEVLENTMAGAPVSYLHGSTAILSPLQRQLEGMVAGDRKTIHLLRQDSSAGEDFCFEVEIDEVRPATADEQVLGYPVAVQSTECGADCDCHSQQGR